MTVLVEPKLGTRIPLVCPKTGAPLEWDSSGVFCPATGEQWDCLADTPVFTTLEGHASTDPDEEMQRFLHEADTLGWERALREHLRGENVDPHGERGGARSPDSRLRCATDPTCADWRFLVPLSEQSRVLDIGAGWGARSMAIAPEVEALVASEDRVDRARFIAIRARQLGLENVMTVATLAHEIPFPDGSFDLVILDGVLDGVGVSHVRENPRDVQRLVLENVYRKLAPGGHVYVAAENRWGYHSYLRGPDGHPKIWGTNLLPRVLANLVAKRRTGQEYRASTSGMDGYRKLLQQSGFVDFDFYALVPNSRNPVELVPLGSREVFEYCANRVRAESPHRKILAYAIKAAFRSRLLPRVMPHYGIVARKGGAR